MGEVIRAVDRGITACDTLMKWGFLWLLPSVIECVVTCVLFWLYFREAALALAVFGGLFLYVYSTVRVTLWRKKLQASVNKADNAWHDSITDSLVNFETIK